MRPRKEIEEQSFEPPQATRKLEHTYLEGTQIRWFILTKRRSYTIPGLTPKTNGRPGEIAVRSDSGCRHGYLESMLGMSEISCSASQSSVTVDRGQILCGVQPLDSDIAGYMIKQNCRGRGILQTSYLSARAKAMDIRPWISALGYPSLSWEAEKYNATYNRARNCQTTHGIMDFFGQNPRTTHTQTLNVSHLTQKYHRHLPHPMAIDVSMCRFRPTELPMNFLFCLSYRGIAHKEE